MRKIYVRIIIGIMVVMTMFGTTTVSTMAYNKSKKTSSKEYSDKKGSKKSSKSSGKTKKDPSSIENYRDGGMEKLDGGGDKWDYNHDGKYSLFEENARRAYDEELRRDMFGY